MLAAESLLQVWECGQQCPPALRTLRLLALALPDQARERIADCDLGLRDWHLLRLWLEWFGPELSGYTDCAQCGERLEIALDAGVMISGGPPHDPPTFTSRDGHRFRLPTMGDLIATADAADDDRAPHYLFERCRIDDAPVDGGTDLLFDEVDAGLAALARDRGIHVRVSCALCGATSEYPLDPGEFLWSGITAGAAALLDEVDELARAYGWPERDILAMSAARRGGYLTRVGR